LYASCKEPSGNSGNEYNNPNAGISREPPFSHKSGLYSKAFDLTLTAKEGNRIYYSTDGSIPLPSKATSEGPVFLYNSPIKIKNRNGQPNVLASAKNVSKMYGRTNDPRGFMPDPYYPTAAQVPKATVIRVMEVDSSGNQGEVLTRTYFIGDNLVKYGNNVVLSLVTDPDNLIDDDIGIYVQGRDKWWPDYNFNKKGRDWEREANLEFFDSQRNVSLSTGAGIRVRGGWSRDRGQKGFNVYFREEYGLNNLKNYNLIPGAVQSDGKTPVATYKNFMLRNGGNDTEYTKFYDVYLQSLLADRNFTTQAAIPCVAYLNGEYWGFYNLQEKYSDNYLEYKFGVNRNNVVSVENWELAEGVESDMDAFWDMINSNFLHKDMTVPAHYAEFCDVFDIQSYIDYYAAQIYIYNEDWPHNNWQLWKVRNKEPGNPYGDGKWRWMMFDTEFAMGIYSGGALDVQNGRDTFDQILNGNNSFNNVIFKNLMKNPDFCRQFVITMMDLYNVNFDYNSCMDKLNTIAAVYGPLMKHYYERFGCPWPTVFENKVADAKKYLNDIRNAMTNNYLPRYFGHLGIAANKLVNVTLSAKCNGANVPDASIKINTTTPVRASGSWTGKYYTTYPVTVTANVPGGYTFTGWTVTGGTAVTPSALTTTVNFAGNVQITANYQ
jgi:hypothetical protein